MMRDIATVMWKEWKEILLFRSRAGRFGNVAGLLMLLGVFGVYLPLISGREWVTSPLMLGAWAWVPYLLIVGVVADSFAGERERHTLETLLASRLPDRAILLGKMGACLGYGWGVALVSLLLSLVTLNLAFAEGELLIYPAATLAAILGLSLLVSLLAASLGVLIPLRASSPQQAQQRLSLSSILLFMFPILAIQIAPDAWLARLSTMLAGSRLNGLFLTFGVSLLVLDAGLVLACMARFQRARLILD